MVARFYSPGEIEILVLLDDHGPLTLRELSYRRATPTNPNTRGGTLQITRRLVKEGVLLKQGDTFALNGDNDRIKRFRAEKRRYDTKAVLNRLEKMPDLKM
jgi:hypothetical protein